MHDPRFDRLAQLLVEYSTRLKRNETVLIEAFDVPDEMVIALIRAARKVGAIGSGLRGAFSWWGDPIIPQFTEDATLVAMDANRKLLLWDPRTGAKRPFPS